MTRILLRGSIVVTLALCLLKSSLVGAQGPGAPKLLVIVVVDQLRADYLSLFERNWKGGFRTLLNEGAVFEKAEYPYQTTVTCAGHTTIGTGAWPSTHGMFTNSWWHREERKTLDCTDDDKAPDISYGRPVKLGNSAKRLMVPTLADELREQRPGARVVSISLKARSAIGLAGHAGDVVTWFDDAAGSFATSRAFAKQPVEAMKEFIARDPFEKDQGKIWTLKDPPASYRWRDAGLGERPPTPWNGLFPHTIAGRAPLDAMFFDVWQTSPFADEYLQRMAIAMVDSLKLGQREATDFLAVAFSSLDEVGHDFGPESREVEDLLRRLDLTLGAFIDRLDKTVGRGNYVLALTADHGVAPVARLALGGRIITEEIRERIEETLTIQFGPLQKGSYIDAVNYQYVYFAPGIFDRLRASPAVMRAVDEAVMEIPGVARVLRGDQLSSTSPDRFVRSAALSYVSGRSGDLVVVPKENWYLQPRNSNTATTHGTQYSYDTHVPVVLLGGSVKPGRVKNRATPADVAPTLAHLGGIHMPKANGRVLHEGLK